MQVLTIDTNAHLRSFSPCKCLGTVMLPPRCNATAIGRFPGIQPSQATSPAAKPHPPFFRGSTPDNRFRPAPGSPRCSYPHGISGARGGQERIMNDEAGGGTGGTEESRCLGPCPLPCLRCVPCLISYRGVAPGRSSGNGQFPGVRGQSGSVDPAFRTKADPQFSP